MIPQEIKDKLKVLHNEENELNYEMAKIDKAIKQLEKDKSKLAKRISFNMKKRNQLIFSKY